LDGNATDPLNPSDRLVYSKRVWALLPTIHQAALNVHEAIYKVLRTYYGDKDSIRTRLAVGLLFSDSASDDALKAVLPADRFYPESALPYGAKLKELFQRFSSGVTPQINPDEVEPGDSGSLSVSRTCYLYPVVHGWSPEDIKVFTLRLDVAHSRENPTDYGFGRAGYRDEVSFLDYLGHGEKGPYYVWVDPVSLKFFNKGCGDLTVTNLRADPASGDWIFLDRYEECLEWYKPWNLRRDYRRCLKEKTDPRSFYFCPKNLSASTPRDEPMRRD
jgi:hypothetical protein